MLDTKKFAARETTQPILENYRSHEFDSLGVQSAAAPGYRFLEARAIDNLENGGIDVLIGC
jgi:hypothetical protein